MSRRADGTLEADVMQALWSLGRPASPREVLEATGSDLAYTSIATTLGRLRDKGLVARVRRGRVFLYTPVSEVELTSRRIRTVLDAASDRETALTGFVEALDAQEASRLLEILDER